MDLTVILFCASISHSLPFFFFVWFYFCTSLLIASFAYIFIHYSRIFIIIQEGEPVEFSVVVDDNGRSKAENVTGPMGAFVQGAPRRPRFDEGNFGDGGFGGGGFGGGGFGSN